MKNIVLFLSILFLLVECNNNNDENTCNCDQITENNHLEAQLYVQGHANNYHNDVDGWVITGSASVNVDCNRNGEKKIVQQTLYATMPDGEKVYKTTRTRMKCQ